LFTEKGILYNKLHQAFFPKPLRQIKFLILLSNNFNTDDNNILLTVRKPAQ